MTFEPRVGATITASADALRVRAKQPQASRSTLNAADQNELNELTSRVVLGDNLNSILDEIERKRRFQT